MTQNAAKFFFILRDHFRDAASSFWLDSGAAEIGVEFQEIWMSQNLEEALLEIAKDMAREEAMDEDALNDFVDAALAKIAWCDIAASIADASEDAGHE